MKRYILQTQIKVQCYSGHKAEERPLSFTDGETTLRVEEIVDRWYDVDGNYFKVRAEDGVVYLLRHDLNSDNWQLVSQS